MHGNRFESCLVAVVVPNKYKLQAREYSVCMTGCREYSCWQLGAGLALSKYRPKIRMRGLHVAWLGGWVQKVSRDIHLGPTTAKHETAAVDFLNGRTRRCSCLLHVQVQVPAQEHHCELRTEAGQWPGSLTCPFCANLSNL